MIQDSYGSFKIFSDAFTVWAQRIQKVQADSLSTFDLLEKELNLTDKKKYSKSADLFLVNGTVYWLALARIAKDLALTAEHLAQQCNKISGYQIDIGELDDVFRQQTEWNQKYSGHSGQTGDGNPERH